MNVLNIFAALLAFFLAVGISWAIYTPINNLMSIFPTELYVFCAMAYIALTVFITLIIPISLGISDDLGTI